MLSGVTIGRVKSVGIGLSILLLVFFLIPLPQPLFDAPYVTTLHSSDGTLLSAKIATDQQWRFPASDSIPEKFETAILLFEDEYFHYHPGVNPISLFRAFKQNVRTGKVVSGGSTISMQTVRMAFGNQSRSYGQKLLEILTAFKLEILYTKQSILQAYCDHAPFGGNIVGVNAAAWRYYGRSPHQLSWAESATLAILPNRPSSIFPGSNNESLIQKRDRLLDKLHDRGHLSEEDLFLAKQEPLPKKVRALPNYAYHLLHRATGELGEGQRIVTTLDKKLQVRAGKIVERYSQKMGENHIYNAAAIILNIHSGKTLAYIGNSSNRGSHGQHVDIVTAKRSPGSLLKPFLYAAAMDDGLITPNQLLPDVPLFYRGFSPKNFDKAYRGAVPANEALVSSLNVPFVHLLIDYGYEHFHQKMRKVGFKSFNEPAGHYGLSIILGGAETSLWELTSAYAGMARAVTNYMDRPYNKGYSEGDYHPNSYLIETDEEDKKLSKDGLLRAPSIQYTFNTLQAVKRPEEETGWEYFGSSRPISWKTGTSYGFRDGWAIGLNGQHLVGVWIGNADGEGRPGLTGVRAAAPLMFELFGLLGSDSQWLEDFGAPVSICKESGMLASDLCTEVVSMALPDYMTTGSTCRFHQVVHLDREGEYRVNSSCYNVADILESTWFVLPPAQSWFYKKSHPNYRKLPPYSQGCLETDASSSFELIYPRQFTKVHIPNEQDGKKGKVVFEAAHENKDGLIYWHLDDHFLGTTKGNHQMGINTTAGVHTVTLIDETGNELKQGFEVIN